MLIVCSTCINGSLCPRSYPATPNGLKKIKSSILPISASFAGDAILAIVLIMIGLIALSYSPCAHALKTLPLAAKGALIGSGFLLLAVDTVYISCLTKRANRTLRKIETTLAKSDDRIQKASSETLSSITSLVNKNQAFKKTLEEKLSKIELEIKAHEVVISPIQREEEERMLELKLKLLIETRETLKNQIQEVDKEYRILEKKAKNLETFVKETEEAK